ncbi:MAG: di-heme oxidoredictase family protein [Spongiibacteraceae bacterium]|jgi:CxxC motif-containing protein (DUF1111 family)|nr:di-heme oxidoredictase family protein [Spongiibacteraceae bacterium]
MKQPAHPALRRLLAGWLIASASAGSAVAASADPAETQRIAAVTRPTQDFSRAEPFEANPAGAATVTAQLNATAFSYPSGNMSFERQLDFRVGDGIFRKLWVSAPSSTRSSDGLGPLFNARSCQTCHLRDGRGQPPRGDDPATALFLRLSIPPQTPADHAALASGQATVIAEPTYGTQLQNFAVAGLSPEGQMVIDFEAVPITLADGAVVELQKPRYRIERLGYGPLHPETMLSPRIASPMIGMGLLEAIPAEAILAREDPDDRDGDGISGRANWVWDNETGQLELGRFGWKAGQPSVALQSAHAFAGDMGIASPLVQLPAGDCTERQPDCLAAPHGVEPGTQLEIDQQMFDLVVFYSRNLGVPARRDVNDPQVLAGKKLFYEAGCTGCHTPKFVTRRDSAGPEQSFQLIWPYTDLLLHDMGEGLADNRPEGRASGREWRTPPLWGLGLTAHVSGETTFLHDGRARSILEAILWHGGEAQAARDRVVAMSKAERDQLLAFLNSL